MAASRNAFLQPTERTRALKGAWETSPPAPPSIHVTPNIPRRRGVSEEPKELRVTLWCGVAGGVWFNGVSVLEGSFGLFLGGLLVGV